MLDCITQAVAALAPPLPEGDTAEATLVHAVRGDIYTEEQIADWESDPIAACERLFPGSATLIEKYGIAIQRKPTVSRTDEGAAKIGYTPSRHFGTFLEELRHLDETGGKDAVRSRQWTY